MRFVCADNIVAYRSRHNGKSVQVNRHGSLTWRVPAWWVHWSQCRASPTDHSYVRTL